jgi:hypothetical protein
MDIIIPPLHQRGGGILFYLCPPVIPSVCPSQDIFRRIFLINYWWQKSDIWSQASYRYAILWETFLDLSDSYFLFADLVGFYTHWTYMRGYHKWALAHNSSCYTSAPPEEGVYCFTSVRPSVRPQIFFVTFFSATIDGRNLIFGHKFHISMPYCGKRFWTRQIPTSCLPT